MNTVSTTEMEVALLNFFDVQKNIIVPNVSWGFYGLRYEIDLLVLRSTMYAIEVEIKVSKADLKAERDKDKYSYYNTPPENHNYEHYFNYTGDMDVPMFVEGYFAVPEYLESCALKNIPIESGLIVVGPKTKITKKAIRRGHKHRFTKEQERKLMRLGCMRILKLKTKLLEMEKTNNSDSKPKQPTDKQ